MARKDDLDLIIVTFNCGNDFEFHQKKFEECYANLKATKYSQKVSLNLNSNSTI